MKPAPIYTTLKEAIDRILSDLSWAQDHFAAKSFRQILKDRDGGYFIEGEEGSPPLGHPRVLPGCATAFIEPCHVQDRKTYKFSLVGINLHIYESNNDGSMPSGKLFWENGVLTPVPEPKVVTFQPSSQSCEHHDREEEQKRWRERIEKNHPHAAYFLCYFRQQEQLWGNPTMEVSFIHPKPFPRDQAEEAQRKAKELEQERYDKKDMNLQIEARLAESAEDAKAGIFLDN
jgi:hypothetical protein